jgi:hypothetical protein
MLGLALALAMAAPHPVAVKSWEDEGNCSWWLSRETDNGLHASIGPGDPGLLVLTIGDPVFMTWSESDRPEVTLRFNGDPKRTVTVEGWASTAGGTVGMFGMYLDADGRAKLANANSLELIRGGEVVVRLQLAETPGKDAMEECVPGPLDDWSAEEH